MDRLGLMLGIAVETAGDAVALMMLVCGMGLIVTAAGLGLWLWITSERVTDDSGDRAIRRSPLQVTYDDR